MPGVFLRLLFFSFLWYWFFSRLPRGPRLRGAQLCTTTGTLVPGPGPALLSQRTRKACCLGLPGHGSDTLTKKLPAPAEEKAQPQQLPTPWVQHCGWRCCPLLHDTEQLLWPTQALASCAETLAPQLPGLTF